MADLQVAVSEEALNRLFQTLMGKFTQAASETRNFGPFTATYSAGFRLENGQLSCEPDGTVRISGLDIVYDPLHVVAGIDVPGFELIGGFTVKLPLGGRIRIPGIGVFNDDPDFGVSLNLDGIIVTEVSGNCAAKLKRQTDPAGIGLTRWAAHAAGHADHWQVFLVPDGIHINVIDIPDTAANIVDRFVDDAVEGLLSAVAGPLAGLVRQALGPLTTYIRRLFGIGSDAVAWLTGLLAIDLRIFEDAANRLIEFLARTHPVFAFEDPFPLLRAQWTSVPLIPVLVPVLTPAIDVTDDELIISTSVGVL